MRFWCLGIDVPHYKIFGLTKKLKIVNHPYTYIAKKRNTDFFSHFSSHIFSSKFIDNISIVFPACFFVTFLPFSGKLPILIQCSKNSTFCNFYICYVYTRITHRLLVKIFIKVFFITQLKTRVLKQMFHHLLL